jgi:hypothetical protein
MRSSCSRGDLLGWSAFRASERSRTNLREPRWGGEASSLGSARSWASWCSAWRIARRCRSISAQLGAVSATVAPAEPVERPLGLREPLCGAGAGLFELLPFDGT